MYLPRRFINFDIIGLLGSGSYGSVLSAVDTITGTKIAVKFIKKNGDHPNTESKIQSMLIHDNLCRLYGCIDTPHDSVLILELIKGMDLHRYLKSHGTLNENHAKSLFIQMIHAVDYLHSHSIVHRDLKLENIMISDDGSIKICDFGLSTFYDRYSVLRDYCGTPRCAPPEIMNGVPYIGPEVDIWCLGIILYTMVHGRLPFENNGKFPTGFLQANMKMDESLSHELRHLIKSLIEPDRSRRIGMSQLMRHPWLNITRREYRKNILFVDNNIIERLVGIGFDRMNIMKRISDINSKESSIYSLIKRNRSSGYDSFISSPIHHSYDVFDLNITMDTKSNLEHLRRMEKHEILRTMTSTRVGCFPFMFWKRSRIVVKRTLNINLNQSRTLMEKWLSIFPRISFKKKSKYIIYHTNGFESTIDLIRNESFTTCCFTLTKGNKIEFIEFIIDFIRFVNQE